MSAVLDPDELVESAPDEVCVLTEAQQVIGQDFAPLLCTLEQGQVAAQVYSSAATVIGLCGTRQPWRWVRAADVPGMARRYQFDVVLLDIAPPDGPAYAEVDVADAADAEPISDIDEAEIVYLPSRPVRAGDQRVSLELQPDRRGRRALLVYTSADELVVGCGEYQPWVAVPAERLAAVAADAGAEIVLFNPTLSEDARHTGPVQDWTRD